MVSGESSLVAGAFDTPWLGNRSLTPLAIAPSGFYFQTGTLDYSALTAATGSTIASFLASNLVVLRGSTDVVFSTTSDLTLADHIVGDSVWALSLLSSGDVNINATISTNGSGTGTLNIVAGYDGTAGIANGGDPSLSPMFIPAEFLGPAAFAKDLFVNNVLQDHYINLAGPFDHHYRQHHGPLLRGYCR